MKSLIIAEKPSLMRTIVGALKTKGEHFEESKDKEYLESENYVATAQFGHLLNLKLPEEYEERKGINGWDVASLPFFPKKYENIVNRDAKKRFQTIGKLLKRSDISQVYHCGDPDREGQILVDLVLKEHGNTKKVLRPQLKALTNPAILEAFSKAKDNAEYINVYNEGMTRRCFDWDFGINLSQYATAKTNARPALNVGRVIGAICSEIYDRDVAIENFVPEKFFKVVSDVPDEFKLTSKETFPFDQKASAEDYANRLQEGDSVVSSVETRKVKKKRPKLFSQTALQAAMSKLWGYKPDKTLSLAQSLYEKGLITYPRTNTEYVATEEKSSVETALNRINKDGKLEFRTDKTVFDDSKIEGHSAIYITGKKPEGLSEDEMECYKTILYRFMAVFCKEECEYSKTTVVIDNPLETFKVSGETPITFGWQAMDLLAKKKEDKNSSDDEERILPKVSKGDVVATDFKPHEAETKPPAHYSVESLGKWMENPFRKDDADDEELYKNVLAGLQIGTEATRASILAKAEEKGYISLKKKTYYIQPRGRFLVETCRGLGIDFSKEMTANMGKELKDVGRGEIGIMEVLRENRQEITRVIHDNKEVAQDSEKFGGEGEYVKKDKTGPSIFEPTGEEVSFSKEWGGHTFTDDEISSLLKGEVISIEMVSSKGERYIVEGSLKKQKYKGKTYWGFAKEIPSQWCGHVFTDEERDALSSGKKISANDFVSKAGKTFECDLRWKNGSFNPTFPKKKKE